MDVQICKEFLQQGIAQAMAKLTLDSQPTWGSMDAQEMIEHVAMALKGGYTIEFGADKESKPTQLQAKEMFLVQNVPYPKGIPSPFHKNGKPPYQFENLEQAKHHLVQQVKLMYLFFESPENLEKFYFHPYFGKLNFDELQQFNYKHITHHFEQFKIM